MYYQIYTAESEGFLYTNFSENTFNNQIIGIKISEDDLTISDYLYQHFEMKIGETMKYLVFHQNKSPKILKDD